MNTFIMDSVQLYNCDMFEEGRGLSCIQDSSIDAVITDFPYGTLNKRNEWDRVIDY